MTRNSNGYSALQVSLHWAIAALILFQLYAGEDISTYSRAIHKGLTPDATLAFSVDLHIAAGIAVLVLVCARLWLRLTAGVPAPVPAPALQTLAAEAVHWAFYGLLFAVPVTGLIGQYLYWPMGRIHELGKPAFIILIVVHAGAALYHHFVVKDNVLKRMLVPGTV